MKRTALPVRLVAAFNKVKIKGIAKIISLIKLLTARHNHGWSATRSFPRLTRLLCAAFQRHCKTVKFCKFIRFL